MRRYLNCLAALVTGFGLLVGSGAAQENPVTAIDIALEPDDTMVQHAMAANARTVVRLDAAERLADLVAKVAEI